jgi:hypothetical protein
MEEFGPAPIRNYAYPALPNVNLFQLNRLGQLRRDPRFGTALAKYLETS